MVFEAVAENCNASQELLVLNEGEQEKGQVWNTSFINYNIVIFLTNSVISRNI